MRAIDTNVLVRFLTRDDPIQADSARLAIEGGAIFIATTVLLETEWVLRSAYAFPAPRIVDALRRVAGLPGVHVEEPVRLVQALDWMGNGMDFADALHLARTESCTEFLSFDAALGKLAGAMSTISVVAP